jgi:Asp-tRNA(Asn)/Glu-tRNA(Gln) amidotransferase A subunit family amidase
MSAESIDRLQGAFELNVLVHEQFEAAGAAAARSRTSRPPGRLAGVPFLLKDLAEPQAGAAQRMGSRALRDHVAAETAWTVERYLAAGLIICGRTNTPEFGNQHAASASGRAVGLPVGVQLLAPDEAVLLAVAAELELALPWSERSPAAYA